jgi:hypothetical protein
MEWNPKELILLTLYYAILYYKGNGRLWDKKEICIQRTLKKNFLVIFMFFETGSQYVVHAGLYFTVYALLHSPDQT